MGKLEFRKLRADEIDCRIATVTENKGVVLLLYKDARCDMNILDETVGAMNWKREHTRDNANCIVSIWDKEKQQWISKEDTGKESNTEAEKGLASDSFKRACFNWGIGRELYTAPFMWVNASNLDTLKDKKCYDKFKVIEIEYAGDKIAYVKIQNTTNKVEISYGKKNTSETTQSAPKINSNSTIDEVKVKALEERCKADNVAIDTILKLYKVSSLNELTEKKYCNINEYWEDIKKRG